IDQPNLLYQLNNGVATQVTFNLTPGEELSYQWWYSSYFNDNWQLNDELSFNLGIRWDRYRNEYPDARQDVDSFGGRFIPVALVFPGNDDTIHKTTWGPRVGVVWNVKGQGKTLIKFNYGYYGTRPGEKLGNPALQPFSRTYSWTDRNGDL